MFTADSVLSPSDFNYMVDLGGWRMVFIARAGTPGPAGGCVVYESEALNQYIQVRAAGCSCCSFIDDVIDLTHGSEGFGLAFVDVCECITEDGEEVCGGNCDENALYIVQVSPGLFSD